MNKLRVGLLGLVLVCVGLVVKAQDVNWQVRGGGDCATIIGGVTNIDTQFGYHLGGTADIALREDGVFCSHRRGGHLMAIMVANRFWKQNIVPGYIIWNFLCRWRSACV